MDEGYYNFGYIDGSWSSIPNESNNSVRRYVLPLNTATKVIQVYAVILCDHDW